MQDWEFGDSFDFGSKLQTQKCRVKIQDEIPSQNLDSYCRTEDGVKSWGINSEDRCGNIIQYLNEVFEYSDATVMRYLAVVFNAGCIMQ